MEERTLSPVADGQVDWWRVASQKIDQILINLRIRSEDKSVPHALDVVQRCVCVPCAHVDYN